jgi:hypothetical protein
MPHSGDLIQLLRVVGHKGIEFVDQVDQLIYWSAEHVDAVQHIRNT